MNIIGFEKIAKYLAIPLVLIGFVLMLVFGIHSELVKSGLLPQVSQQDAGMIIKLMLRYGFQLGLCVTVLGFALAAWNKFMDKVQPVDAARLAEKLLAPLQGQLEAKDQQIKALTEAIAALSKTGAPAASIKAALQALQQGNTAKAQAVFAEVLKTKEAEGKQANKKAAAAARHLGALAYLHNTNGALTAYRKAVELNPDNAEGWNQLAALFLRTGELAQAEAAYRKVLSLGEAHQDKEEQSAALGNLGIVHRTRGDLDKAEEMHSKALALDEALGSKEGMAAAYGNLGLVYVDRGNLDQAEQMHKKALEISEALGLKGATASCYGNLGFLYHTRGELEQAELMHRKSLEINQALGCKEGLAKQYAGLGIVYFTRGELEQAELMYKKSLEISEALGVKEATARQYCNLGNVYLNRGELEQTAVLWKKSLRLYQEMQHPNAKKVQQGLDDLARQKGSR
jgi:tetratricopeptide (TPR) repeat protein